MTYRQTLDFLYTQLPMYQRVGNIAFKKNLDNIRQLCQALGNPQEQFPTIHLAGTNGKGTTAHLLSAVLQAHGKKTGLYTSPHYRDFRERIKIDGQLIPRASVIRFVEENKNLWQKIEPSFFEITVALAFRHFTQSKIDVGVIETGLGGRLDSTNIITPLLSIITNISKDHQQMLGETLPEIAGEKAGIIKNNIPVVIGEEQAEVKHVFIEKAKASHSPIYFASQNYEVTLVDQSPALANFYQIKKKGVPYLDQVEVNLKGPFQAKNLCTLFQALEVLEQLGFIQIQENQLRSALKNLKTLTRYTGRWQVLDQEPLTITDSAHNEGGLSIVMETLQNIPHQKLHLVIGAVNDKDLDNILSLMPRNAIYYFAKPDIPRGLDAKALQLLACQKGLSGKAYSSVKNAWRAAKRKAQKEDLIFIGGSTFVVAEVV